jgi:hypothetical protein
MGYVSMGRNGSFRVVIQVKRISAVFRLFIHVKPESPAASAI